MKILYCGLLYNYGKKEEGFSYENANLEAGFRDCQSKGMFDVTYYYPDAPSEIDLFSEIYNHDAIFHVAFNESLDLPEQVAKLALKLDKPVIQWDCDASWRFHNWILPRKDRVSHFITTHSMTIPWYKANGMNVIRSQWGGSPLYVKSECEKKYDVSFIGQKHGIMPNGKFWRGAIIDELRKSDVEVDLFGNYWDGYPNWHGYSKSFEDVIRVLNESKICLNLSNPWHYNTLPQIKGRHFEIPQVAGFQVCTPADDLQEYFKFDEEIVVASSVGGLVDKITYYLKNDKERQKIANAAYLRMLKDHQWHHRFEQIFKEVGL